MKASEILGAALIHRQEAKDIYNNPEVVEAADRVIEMLEAYIRDDPDNYFTPYEVAEVMITARLLTNQLSH